MRLAEAELIQVSARAGRALGGIEFGGQGGDSAIRLYFQGFG
jgi:hypothetical protein